MRIMSDFWEWVDEGMSEENEREDNGPIEGCTWGGTEPPLPGETEAQQKCQNVQEALFDALY